MKNYGKQLSTISLNLIHAMDGASFTSQVLGGYVEIWIGVVTQNARAIELSNAEVELLYQEFVWKLDAKEVGNE